MARAGRKRKSNAKRYPGGAIKQDGELYMPKVIDNDIVVTGDRGKRFMRRKSIMEKLKFDERECAAGDEFRRCWEQCRLHWADAPPINAKVSNLLPTQAHAPSELPAEIIRLGERCHKRYQDTVRYIVKEHGSGTIRALITLCVECKEPANLDAARAGIASLVKYYGL